MRTSFHHQSEAQPPNGPLTAATSPEHAQPRSAIGIGCCGHLGNLNSKLWTSRAFEMGTTKESPAEAGPVFSQLTGTVIASAHLQGLAIFKNREPPGCFR
jgi:hypothetical protein